MLFLFTNKKIPILTNLYCLSYFRSIRDCLVSFLKVSAKKSEVGTERNPSWITCLPIIHFLDGSLHPFEGMDYATFQDKREDWWIISEFKQEKEELKNRKWSRWFAELFRCFFRHLFMKDWSLFPIGLFEALCFRPKNPSTCFTFLLNILGLV